MLQNIFGGDLENLDSHKAKTTRIGHFESNEQFLSIVLHKNSIVFHIFVPVKTC